MSDYRILQGDALERLRELPSDSFDAMLCDPPAGISFMNKKWDGDKGGRDQWIAWLADVMREARRCLKPGAYALVWALPRTSHWTAMAIENAGFEVRDVVTHVFGCLSDDTEILLDSGWTRYRNIDEGDLALCYDAEHDEFRWQRVEEVVSYAYADTAFRIRSDRTDQLVSREHRCLVERDGGYAFARADSLEREARVPVLEDVHELLAALPVPYEGTGGSERIVCGVSRIAHLEGEKGCLPNARSDMPALSQDVPSSSRSADIAREILHQKMLGSCTVSGPEVRGEDAEDRGIGSVGMDGRERGLVSGEDERSEESGLAGRSHFQAEQGELHRAEVREMSEGVRQDVAQGRLRDGASTSRRSADRSLADAHGVSAPRRPQHAEQLTIEPSALRDEPRSQAVRGARFTRTDLATVEPVLYEGIVWCVRVPTGAFVARRNGKAFVTGNSGFPKSLDLSKAIDAHFGAEREVVGTRTLTGNAAVSTKEKGGTYGVQVGTAPAKEVDVTTAATPEAAAYDGYGTALKPASEHWILARKPLEGTYAENALKWGTGGIAIDACRIGYASEGDQAAAAQRACHDQNAGRTAYGDFNNGAASLPGYFEKQALGRWPANLMLSHADGCERTGSSTSIRSVPRGVSVRNNKNAIYGPGLGGRPEKVEEVEEVEEVFSCVSGCPVKLLDEQSGDRPGMSGGGAHHSEYEGGMFGAIDSTSTARADTGGASRFFYVAKASRFERELGCEHLPKKSAGEMVDREDESDGMKSPRAGAGRTGGARNHHPTIKSVALATYLAKLIKPPKSARLLNPFAGSGTEGIGAMRAGFDEIVCIELEPEYVAIAEARFARWSEIPTHVNPQESKPAKVDERQASLFGGSR